MWSNPQLTLEAIGEANVQNVIRQWFESLEEHKKIWQKKVAILGFCSLLKLPPAAMPQVLAQGYAELFTKTVEVAMNIGQQREQAEKEEKDAEGKDGEEDSSEEEESEEEESEEDEDDCEGHDEDEDVEDEEDEAYMKYLEAIQKGAINFADEDEDYDDDEDDDADSPIAHINEFVLFHHTVNSLAAGANGAGFQQMVQSLPPNVQAAAQTVMARGVQIMQGEGKH